MKRVVVLTDSKRIVITEAEEAKIVKALPNSSERVLINGTPFKKSLIGYFDDPTHEELLGQQEALKIWPEAKVIGQPADAGCRGQYSISMAVITVAKEVSGKQSDRNPDGFTWHKLIADQDWQQTIRDQLWKKSNQWCDNRKRTCACEPGFKPQPFKTPDLR